MKKIFLIAFLFPGIATNSAFCQDHSWHKNYLSVNLTSALINGEVGLIYSRVVSDKYEYDISVGHRFWQFNIVASGGGGGFYDGYAYLPQTASRIGVGLWKNMDPDRVNHNYKSYTIADLTYSYTKTPTYTNRDGSNGLNGIKREEVSDVRHVLNPALGFAIRSKLSDNLILDFTLQAGASIGYKKEHKYSWGGGGSSDTYYYPENTYAETFTFIPTIDLGLCIGYGW